MATPVPDAVCDALPVGNECRSSRKSLILVRRGRGAGGDKLIWKWLRGNAPVDEFGDPANAETRYAFCIYASTGAGTVLVGSAPVQPPESVCAETQCWKKLGRSVAKGFRFTEKETLEDGVNGILLKGGKAGGDKIIVQGKGSYLPLQAPADEKEQLIVQLINSETPTCWTSQFTGTGTKKNNGEQFKAR